jgi:hypothetical protein
VRNRACTAIAAALLLSGCADAPRDLAGCEMEAFKAIPGSDSLRWNGLLFACMKSKGYSFQERPPRCEGGDLRPQNLGCWQRRWPWQ